MPHANGKAPSKHDFDVNSYRQSLRSYSPGRWFKFPREFLWVLTRDQAIALSALIDKADRCVSLTRNKGWFYYTVDMMEWDTNMDRNVQERVLRSLDDAGYIQRVRRGMPPRRYFFIEIAKLEAEMAGAVRQRDALRKKRSRTSRKTLINKLKDKIYNEEI